MSGNPKIAEYGKDTQFKPGESGNPDGKPKGTKHLSTWIHELLNDEEFTAWIPDTREGIKEFKGAPAPAIIKAMMIRALSGDVKAFKALGQYGYGTKVDITSGGEKIQQAPLVVSQIVARSADASAEAETETSS